MSNYENGQSFKRFSLFNTSKWSEVRPECCGVVPVLYNGIFDQSAINTAITDLKEKGSQAAPGFLLIQKVIIQMITDHAANLYFKKTLYKDEEWKGKSK